MRWKEENRQAVREDKDIGLIHCLDVYGPAAFDDQIVEWKRGPRSEVQDWANKREIELIAENGGPFRNPSVRCKQTLNQTKGGQGNVNFESRDTLRTVAWLKFKAELEAYVDCYKTSLVPKAHVNTLSKYNLGSHLKNVRGGELWKGHPDAADRVEWLESLPKWAWDARETDEYKEVLSEIAKKRFESQEARDELSTRGKAQWANADEATRTEWSRKISEAKSTPGAKAAASELAKKQFESQEARDELSTRAKKQFESQEARDELSTRAKKQFESQEARDEASKSAKAQAEREAADGMKSLAERGKEWREKATPEQLSEVSRKISKTMSTSEAKAAASKLGKAQVEREATAGMKSLAERGKGTRTENWTKEQYEAAVAKRKATTAAKRAKIAAGELEDTNAIKRALIKTANRAKVLQGLPEAERKTKEKEYAGIDLKEANRNGRATALLQLPAYSDKGYTWCYRNLTPAQKDGVVFSQDANGVWSARVRDQGSSNAAGSSADHAHV